MNQFFSSYCLVKESHHERPDEGPSAGADVFLCDHGGAVRAGLGAVFLVERASENANLKDKERLEEIEMGVIGYE